jgi:hypothetical protein
MVTTRDLSRSPYAQTLRTVLITYRDADDIKPPATPESFAAQCVRDFSMRVLFHAYDDLAEYVNNKGVIEAELFELAPFVVASGLKDKGDECDVLYSFAMFSREHPNTATATGEELFAVNDNYVFTKRVLQTDIPGALTRAVFESLNLAPSFTRADYLRSRLEAAEVAITPDALRLALTLSDGWAGTLDSLRETASTLEATALALAS